MLRTSQNDSTESHTQTVIPSAAIDFEKYLPDGLGDLSDIQKAIPRIAKDKNITTAIERILPGIPSWHELLRGDARELPSVARSSVHLVLTSPPYWTLKQYNSSDAQLGDVVDYDQFIVELDKVWMRCFESLVPGGRLICVVGDVCLSRRKNGGRHTVVPLHATIQEHCREIGFDNLAPIIWHKIANAAFEVEGSGGSFLGKPYEPNGVIKNDIEFILMQRKSGAYRAPDLATKILSVIPEAHHREWFQQIWHGVTGASTRQHPAPYPLELASRLIRMFSFVGDTVLDPFAGSGTTSIAAVGCGRNSIGYEIDDEYLTLAYRRLRKAADGLFNSATVKLIR